MSAVESFLFAVQSLCPNLTEGELSYLRDCVSVRELGPRQHFIQAGALQREIGFVHSGLLRAYYIDADGNETSVNFVAEKRYATHYASFISQMSSSYFFQCIEPTVLVCLGYEHIQRGYERYPGLERYGRLIAEEVLKQQQQRIESFLFRSAEERYLDFMQDHPSLFNRVSLSHLASYLGIERQSLTRIRKRLAQR
ncbi:MAG: Crp/Fnr family transcriptional regulator [Candidatus Kapabacteria bacterium]|nr:Crp/Fnr family transcriptional regulator [Candidatus Kapabacteria bacterium]